jgi:hypothetical protein
MPVIEHGSFEFAHSFSLLSLSPCTKVVCAHPVLVFFCLLVRGLPAVIRESVFSGRCGSPEGSPFQVYHADFPFSRNLYLISDHIR